MASSSVQNRVETRAPCNLNLPHHIHQLLDQRVVRPSVLRWKVLRQLVGKGPLPQGMLLHLTHCNASSGTKQSKRSKGVKLNDTPRMQVSVEKRAPYHVKADRPFTSKIASPSFNCVWLAYRVAAALKGLG
jgi:hypothetical protein